ncbi:restriction endonuclease subunit S [Campylobacter upsaliensis]|nr:restriction endonuclease subunit S [Campylobacter upsaliensis]EJC0918892.1 restriction endonuclease subunit S [Campylobacter upsaliensis]
MKKHTQSPYESSKVSYKPSGIEWLGEIPQSWEIRRLKHLTILFTGESIKDADKDKYSIVENAIPYIATKDIGLDSNDVNYNNGMFIQNDDTGFKRAYKNSTLLCLEGANAGKKIAFLNQEVCFVNKLCCISNKSKELDSKALFYFFQGSFFKNTFFSNISGLIGGVTTTQLGNFKIPLPPLQEQKEIAEFLDSKCEKIQNYIEKKQKLITLLQEKKQALINEAVCGRVACHTADSHCHTEPLGEVSNPTCHTERSEVSHNTESKRDFSHSLKMTKEKQLSMTTAYKPSGIEYLGLIPHHWEAVKVKFTAYVKGRIGFHGLNSNEFRYDEGAYLVTGNDFDNNEVMWDKCRRVSEERFYEDPNIHLQNNDLLITKDGTIGKTAIVNNCPKQATLNSGIFLVRTMKKMCFVKYLFFIINSQYFKEFVNVKTSGSTIKHLYQSDFHDLKIPLPPLQEQKQIANFLDEKCEKINSAIEKTKRQIELIKEYKNTLINEAVCGRIRVN